MTAPVWTNTAGFLGTLTERRVLLPSIQLAATGATEYSVISGKLPIGLYLTTGGEIRGTPVSVATDTLSTFVVRAKNTDGVSDRTFSFSVTGPDEPLWVTPAGALPVGLNGEYYTINKEYVDYSLRSDTDILTTGNALKYYIGENQGSLPPGLTLTQDGKIRGYVEDSLIIDSQASTTGNYDTEAYDRYPYEHSAINPNDSTSTNSGSVSYEVSLIRQTNPCEVILTTPHDLVDGRQVYITSVEGMGILNGNSYYTKVVNPTTIDLWQDTALTIPVDATTSSYQAYTGGGFVFYGVSSPLQPQSINKIYQFYVTVTDGIASATRLFNIEVVDHNRLRVDNSYISIDQDMYDTSAGYLLAPIWQSKYGDKLPAVSNLGTVRAGREQILTVYDYDPYPLQGPQLFNWSVLSINPDIKLITDNQINPANLPSKNLQGNNAIYFKEASVFPIKGMKIKLNEYIPNTKSTIYTITGVIKTSSTTGILNVDQPLDQTLPDSRIFYAGTVSEHPPGISLDPQTGNLYGKLSYLPAYKSDYRFTIQTIKIDSETGEDTLVNATGGTNATIVGKMYRTLELINRAATGTAGSYLLTLDTTEGLLPGMKVVGSRGLNGGDNTSYIDTVDTVNNQVTLTTPNVADIPDLLENENPGLLLSFIEQDVIPPVGGSSGLPDPATYTGSAGDIILLGKTPAVAYDVLRPLMDGTLYAYVFTGGVTPTWRNLGETVASSQIYILSVLGSIPSSISFVSTSSLGTLMPGEISELAVKAINTNTNYSLAYEIIQGQLPAGLLFKSDGTITGKITNSGQTYFDFSSSTNLMTLDGGLTTIDKNWYFTVRASDAYRLSSVDQEFYISVFQDSITEYTRMYVKPFLSRERRNLYRDFITDSVIFDPVSLYRAYDPEFGLQTQIKMIIETGIEKVDMDVYAEAMGQYFYRKQFYFGEVQSITAQDSNGNDVYEIIYVDIIDNQMIGSVYTAAPVSVSVANMQNTLETIQLDPSTVIGVDERLRPKYMTTLQADTGVAVGFIKAVPLCYTIPGGATKIISRIKSSDFYLNQQGWRQFNFDTDRIVVETAKDTEQPGWLAYPTERR
jgi:hypothetical protein